MPDSLNIPYVSEIGLEVHIQDPDLDQTWVGVQAERVLVQVLGELQAPVGLHGAGGTGRQFVPTTETRIFDGNGYPELPVDDIVPGTPLTVTCYGAAYPDVLLKYNGYNRGHNTLIRPQSSGAILGASYGLSGIFALGIQNISVTTTWGFAAALPNDVSQAILDECTARILRYQDLGLDGAGESLKIGSFEVDTSGGAKNWMNSASVPQLQKNFANVIMAYRSRGNDKLKRIAAGKRMS